MKRRPSFGPMGWVVVIAFGAIAVSFAYLVLLVLSRGL